MTVGLSDPPLGTSVAPTRAESHFARLGRAYGFGAALGFVLAIGALVQTLFVHAVSVAGTLSPEARFDEAQAHWLTQGYWFGNPFWLVTRGSPGHRYLVPVASALHGPLSTTFVAMADEASVPSATGHRVLMAAIFLASALLVGLAVRRLAGATAGVLSALLVVLYPELWVNPATSPVETLVIGVVALLLYGAVRFWQRPSVRGAVEVGFYLGLGVLVRVDLVLLVVLIGLPLVLLAPRVRIVDRLRFLGVMLALVALVAGSWIGRNLDTFSRTVVISDGPSYVVGRANCATTYGGPLIGWATAACPAGAGTVKGAGTTDESVVAARRQHAGTTYASNHLGDVPGVLVARFGRLWNVFRPGQQTQLEVGVGRPAWVSSWGWWWFWVLAPLAVAGGVALRRRRALLFPFVALAVSASITALVAYGDARLRVGADVALAALAGVALEAAWSHRRAIAERLGRLSVPSGRGRHAAGAS